ncbi:hypothetical protein KKB68_02820, partial [Patescibacteria group bacterium]|nr:hypothetical protein [Patescibacteria group bacterium]
PNLGARPLKRVIQKEILNPLSLKIVIGVVKEGDKVNVDFENGAVKFSTSKDLYRAQAGGRKEKVLVK